MNNVNNLLEGASPYQVLSEQSAKLANKWEKSGLLEGITSSTEKNNMSMLLENQAKQLVNEANTTGTGANMQAGNSEAWAGVALPLVRRVFGEIVAKDLVLATTINKMVRMSLSRMGNVQGCDDDRLVHVVSSASGRGQLANQMVLRHKRRVRAFHTTDKG